MSLSFYDAACYIELADSIEISREDMLRIDELFCRAMDNIIDLRASPLKTFGRKFTTMTDMRTCMLAIPPTWGVNIHRKPSQSGEGGKWTCQISMTGPKEMASTGNTVAGKSIAMEAAIIATLLRVGQHLEVNRLTSPDPAPGPMVA
jgi:hypothetical protein